MNLHLNNVIFAKLEICIDFRIILCQKDPTKKVNLKCEEEFKIGIHSKGKILSLLIQLFAIHKICYLFFKMNNIMKISSCNIFSIKYQSNF